MKMQCEARGRHGVQKNNHLRALAHQSKSAPTLETVRWIPGVVEATAQPEKELGGKQRE